MTPPSAPETAAPAMAPAPRAMIAAVVALGVILALGVVVLIVAVFIRISSGGASAPADAAPRLDTTLTLAQGEEIRQVTLDGNRIVVHTDGPKGGQILVYEIRTGRTIARIRVQ